MQESDIYTIDFGRIIEVLLRQWQWIVVITLIFAIGFGAISFAMNRVSTPIYQASVLIASTKMYSTASFGSPIQTVYEEQLGQNAYNLQSRLQSYVQMVKNPWIAQSVLTEIGEKLPEGQRSVKYLLSIVSGELIKGTDTLEITVKNHTPELAAEIANAWARKYVEHVNTVYSPSGTQNTYATIKEQADEAWQHYQEAQADYEEFTTNNKIDHLNRRIEELQKVIQGLSENRVILVNSLITTQSQMLQEAYNQQAEDIKQQLVQAYEQRRRVDQLLLDTQNMLDQVRRGGEGAAASNALALTLLKAQVFAAAGGIENIQFQTSPSEMTAGAMITDLESMIAVLESRRDSLDKQVKSLSEQLLVEQTTSPIQSTLAGEAQKVIQSAEGMETLSLSFPLDSPLERQIEALEQQVRNLQTQLDQETARKQELTRARDLAWTTYDSLVTKEAEMAITIKTSSSEVAIASIATPDSTTIINQTSVSNLATQMALAAASGAILSIILAYLVEFWWRYKAITPKPILSFRLTDRKRA